MSDPNPADPMMPGDGVMGDAHTGADPHLPSDPGSSGDTGMGDPAWHDRVVFVTSGEWNGDLKSAGGQSTALASADALCATAASAASLSGSFRAYLSVSSVGVNAIGRMQTGGPWKNTHGDLLWSNLQDFIDDWPAVPVRYDERGNELDDYEYVWTGSTEAGESSGTDCWSWELAYDNGAVGDPHLTNGFSHKEDRGCGQTMHLYCFEQ